MNSQRVKQLSRNPSLITRAELEELLALRHTVRNLETQVGGLLRQANQSHGLYGQTKQQVQSLGQNLDDERKHGTNQGRTHISEHNDQRHGVGPYTKDAVNAEDI